MSNTKLTVGNILHTRLVHIVLISGCIVLYIVSCCRREPISEDLPGECTVILPGRWEKNQHSKQNGLRITEFSSGNNSVIRIVSKPAPKTPLSLQVQKDRNNIHALKNYTILLEKQTEVNGTPAVIFIMTFVKKGIRCKAKTILLKAHSLLIYATLTSPEEQFGSYTNDFNRMIETLLNGNNHE